MKPDDVPEASGKEASREALIFTLLAALPVAGLLVGFLELAELLGGNLVDKPIQNADSAVLFLGPVLFCAVAFLIGWWSGFGEARRRVEASVYVQARRERRGR